MSETNTQQVNENGVLIHCNNIECTQIIEYFISYALPDYCSWTCKTIQKDREGVDNEPFSADDFINMIDTYQERAQKFSINLIVSREDYKKLVKAIVDSGVKLEWGVEMHHD